MCSVIGQTISGLVRVLHEIVLPDSNTLAACEEFLERTRKCYTGVPLIVYIYGDPSGESRQTSASRTDWQLVKECFRRYPDRFQVQFRVPSSHGPSKTGSTASTPCIGTMLASGVSCSILSAAN